jgi:hypothetical protein
MIKGKHHNTSSQAANELIYIWWDW